MSVDREWITRELRSALRALAAPGPEALASVPDRTVKADELALDYDNFVQAFLGNCSNEISSAQREGLLAVDAMLETMSGPDKAELWTEDAVVNHAAWRAVRAVARHALATLARDD